MSDEHPEEAAPPKKRRAKTGLIVGVVLAVNLAATGAIAFRVLGATPEIATAAAEPAEENPAVIAGPVVPLDPFVVNLRDEGMSRYLKTSFELELSDRHAADELAKAKRVVRDDLLRYLSSLAVADTLGEEGKQRIQDAVVTRLGRVLGDGKVRRLFFTDFVVQ